MRVLTEVKFLKRTLRWHEQEMCFSWNGGTRYVAWLAVLLGLADTRAVTKTRTPGTKATGGGALEPLDTLQAATFRSALGLIGYIVLDRPDCQYAAKAVRSAAREPTKLDWMRMMRLAKFLVATANSNGSIRRRMCRLRLGRLGYANQHNRGVRTGCTASHRIQLLNSARRRYLKRRGRAVCNMTCGGRRVAVSSAVRRGWNGSEGGSVTDGTANLGVHNRIGSGRVRHLDVKWLWTQEAVKAWRFSLKKVLHLQQRERSDDETSR